MNGVKLSNRQLASVFKTNYQAYAIYENADIDRFLYGLFNLSGCFAVGWGIGGLFSEEGPSIVPFAIGGVLIFMSIPFTRSYNRKISKAVGIYNEGLSSTSFWDDKELNLAFTGNGVGLRLTF